MTFTQDTLRKIQLKELEILLEVKRICEKHQIGYQLCGGTLLGAVRHQGFIPWDDDIDITMLRDDYERFLDVAPEEISNRFSIESARTGPNYIFPYCKVRANGTRLVEEGLASLDMHHGIWIDIFPLDMVAEANYEILDKQNRKVNVIQTSILYSAGVASLTKPLSILFFTLHGFLFHNKLVTRRERLLRKYHCRDGKFVVDYSCPYGYRKTVFPVTMYRNLIEVDFEGHQFTTVNNPHRYLTQMYGDYMQLPPEEKRTSGHAIIQCEV